MNLHSQFLPMWRCLVSALLLLALPISVRAVPVDQSFGYDALNRLTTAAGGSYNYDAAGNLLQITAPAAPLIAIEQPAGTGLTDGVSSISFGGMNVGSNSSAFTFTIKNSGTADLTGLTVTKDGSHSGDFAINTTGMLGAVPVGSSTTTFTVTFTPSANGVRTAALHITSNDSPRSPFDVSLSGTGLSLLEGWRLLNFGSTGNSGDAADTADFDKDGLPNLIEWACNLNPTTASTLPAAASRNGASIEFTYTRSVSALNAGAGFAVRWSDTLAGGSWSTTGVTESILSDNGTIQQVKATVPAGSAGRRFIHLQVSGPP